MPTSYFFFVRTTSNGLQAVHPSVFWAQELMPSARQHFIHTNTSPTRVPYPHHRLHQTLPPCPREATYLPGRTPNNTHLPMDLFPLIPAQVDDDVPVLVNAPSTPPSAPMHPCGQCEETFETATARKHHIRRLHQTKTKVKFADGGM